jgi:hypothetical protein
MDEGLSFLSLEPLYVGAPHPSLTPPLSLPTKLTNRTDKLCCTDTGYGYGDTAIRDFSEYKMH